MTLRRKTKITSNQMKRCFALQAMPLIAKLASVSDEMRVQVGG